MNQYQLTAQVRHLRYVCFVSSNYSYEGLFLLLLNCQQYWGGRYTPIIPVQDNVIPAGYAALLSHYDPDYVLYSAGVDVELIKQLRCFNPVGYFELDDQGQSREWHGVYAFHLLSEVDPATPVLVAAGISNFENPLLDFYKLNYGLVTSSYVGDNEITRHRPTLEVTAENFAALNQLIHHQKPVLRSQLARRNLHNVILRTLTSHASNLTELVVARDKQSLEDLLYFWNRQLFECRNVLYCTLEELTSLGQDQFFGGVLHDLSSWDLPIEVVSFSLSEEEVNDLLVSVLRPIAFQRQFRYCAIPEFPFAVQDAAGHRMHKSNEQPLTQTLITESGLLRLPTPSFSNKLSFYSQYWTVDLEITQRTAEHRNRLMFPLTTEIGFVVKSFTGRVRLGREISIVVPSQGSESVDATIELPTFPQLLRQLVALPVRHGQLTHSRFPDQGPHDSSNRLAAFISIFNQDFTLVEDFFDDKFWVDTFEKLCISEALAGDAVLFEDLVAACRTVLPQRGVVLGDRDATFQNEENLRLGLKRTVQELCGYGALLPGFKLKCTHCSSIFWYPLKGAAEAVQCNGCLREFAFPVEQPFAYKLNNVIKNNMFQSRSMRDGNLTVIRTLASLHRRARKSFGYSPQVNLFDDLHSNRPSSELDIAAIVDGQFIIGEAKHNSAAFSADNNKSLRGLVDVAKEIYPDQIILACYEDQHGKLARAERALIHLFNRWEYQPTISTLLIHEPSYFNLTGYRYFLH